ncbi:MAG TPA: LysR family transcriptional regulator [Pusillimonas sp.]|jgi:DNA-binding transcriptional LysR family regulator|nr:LysR family transcriptional regulator [Pusillimonas sp.]HBT31722.1 LysR family transcriptional regulator [Pusillimonas sp.]HCP79551.1 LysR family transcriptional regulator [Pusillimonas sp.]|tara:strand:- start:49315 stop:50202 length:888 start_codon:yes stop_codon:yes gene_type:complete
MDLKQMRYFLMLAQEQNFGRAAAKLHITQPPLTRHIKALEEELGVTLFTRTPKGAELTESGRALLEEVPNVLALSRRAEERAQLAEQGYIGRLDVAFFSSGVLNAIPRILSEFRQRRPKVKVALYNMTKAQQLEALRERRITIGFNRLVPDEDDLAVEIVLREPFLVGLYKGHPLCKRTYITLADLDNEPLVVYPNAPMHGLGEEIAAAFRIEGLKFKVEQATDDIVTCIAMVASGFGVCITTQSAQTLNLPNVVYRPLRSETLKDIELSCMYRRDDTSPILHAFLKLVRQFNYD